MLRLPPKVFGSLQERYTWPTVAKLRTKLHLLTIPAITSAAGHMVEVRTSCHIRAPGANMEASHASY